MALLIILMIVLGWSMGDDEAAFQLHKSVGITLLFLTIARIIWRLLNPPPPLPAGITRFEAGLSKLVQFSFYAAMLLVPLGGWLLVSVSPFQVATVLYGTISWPHLPFTEGFQREDFAETIESLHGAGAWLILGLLALHVAGAIKHELGPEEGVMKRMVPGLFGDTAPPAAPARGFLAAFGASLALFVAIATAPALAGGAAPIAAAPISAGEAGHEQANWELDAKVSEIRFSGVHDRVPYEGRFSDWTARIYFDPADLVASSVTVTVATATAATGKKLYDDSLRGREWFNPATYPVATVRISGFEGGPETYRATATLTVKDRTISIPLTFELKIDGQRARFRGEVNLSRKALDLGQQSDPGADYVADAVTVRFGGEATRRP